MLQVDFVQNMFSPASFVWLVKLLILIIQVIYVLFAFMLTRQINIMNRNFQTTLAPSFRFFAGIHFLASLIILALSVLAF